MIELEDKEWTVHVCQGSKCKKKKENFLKPFAKALKKEGLKGFVRIQKTQCNDQCKCAPVISVEPERKWYGKADEELARRLIGKIKDSLERKPDGRA